MSEVPVIYGSDRKIMVTEEQKELVKSMVFPGCSDGEMRLFMFECERRGVHPLDRLIFPVARKDGDEPGKKKITFQCSIDYLRAEAVDTGEYDGQDDPEYGPDSADGHPLWASVSVYKKGIDRAIKGTARWSEFYPGEKQGFMWRKMPYHMLAKCAEVLALRKAFPRRLSGLYVPEEMAGDGEKKATVSESVKKKEGKKADSKEKTVNDTLAEELAAYCPDEAMRPALLKQITAFKNEKGETVTAADISKMSNKWAGTALGKLRELVKKKQDGDLPANCPKNPRECEHSGWVDGKAGCGPDGTPCRFGEVKG